MFSLYNSYITVALLTYMLFYYLKSLFKNAVYSFSFIVISILSILSESANNIGVWLNLVPVGPIALKMKLSTLKQFVSNPFSALFFISIVTWI